MHLLLREIFQIFHPAGAYTLVPSFLNKINKENRRSMNAGQDNISILQVGYPTITWWMACHRHIYLRSFDVHFVSMW
jgi:hypothetical protein